MTHENNHEHLDSLETYRKRVRQIHDNSKFGWDSDDLEKYGRHVRQKHADGYVMVELRAGVWGWERVQ